jgi:putative oxygen-independent coproporphyrinogen III oxidase
MTTGEPRSVYVHVPFCRHRCGYCDFTLVAGRDDLIESYLAALDRELDSAAGTVELDTLFLGGGTPTHLSPAQLARLFDFLFRRFHLVAGAEFSVEANPADITDERVAVLADAGVNRVSLGVQSFDDAILRTLERDHDAAIVETAVERLRRRIENVSLDLIFAVPGQSRSLWKETLRQAIALRPTHVSAYGLTVEKGTAFWNRRRKGFLPSLPDEVERQMYAAAMDDLTAAGFEQYEISNFARPGFACRHNEVYWTGRPYLAFGPGAASFVNGVRETNHRSVTTWINRVLSGQSPLMESEQLPPEDAARERLVIGLRRTVGIDLAAFSTETGFKIDQLAAEPIQRHVTGGLLERTPTHLRLTREGQFLSDSVTVDLL